MTKVMRWNPIREMVAMQNAMDRIFENTTPNRNVDRSLALDVHENETSYVIIAALPGLNAEDVKVNIHDNVLTISGETNSNYEQKDGDRALLLERTYGKFSRSVRLPKEIDHNAVEAVYNNGVLTLTLPKTPEAQPKTIPVRVSNGVVNVNTASAETAEQN